MIKGRVLVAMSGGVDSSVAAAVLLEQGYECIGATMLLGSEAALGGDTGARYSSTAVEDAQLVASSLGIQHHVFDLTQEFRKTVIDAFAEQCSL